MLGSVSGSRHARLSISLLGSFAVSVEGQPINLSRKSRALLSYLAMNLDRAVDRESLADLLWDERRGRDPRHNLRQCLVELHKSHEAFRNFLIVRRETMLMPSTLCDVDALEFVEAAKAGMMDQAAALYTGEFLANTKLEVERFNSWARERRTRLSEIAGQLFECQAQAAFASGDGKKALDFGERLITIDPLREDWQRQVLQIYARYRGRHQAIAHARELVALLRRDLNVTPEPETLALLERISKGTPTLVPGQMPELAV